MDVKFLTKKSLLEYNQKVTHLMQSWQWGEFRKSLGTPLYRFGLYKDGKISKAFQLTLHKIPLTPYYIGYLPKGPFPDSELTEALLKIGKNNQCAFIKVEPNIEKGGINQKLQMDKRFKPSPKPYFTKYNYLIDLTKSEDELLKNMYPKSRYNIKIAQKHGVIVEERTDEEAFDIHLKLYFDTTKRQGYFGHNEIYHRKVWQTLKEAKMARVLIAFYTPPGSNKKIPLSSWELFNFKDTLYYPYGGSSDKYRNVMATNLLVWEAIKLGKKLGFKKFDLWGAAEPGEDPNHPWQGFTTFKKRLGAELVEYIGTFDLVFNYPVYVLVTALDKFTKLKAILLKLVGK